jgi:hypothetical protein
MMSGCRQCCERHGYKPRGYNDLAHFSFSFDAEFAKNSVLSSASFFALPPGTASLY